MKRIAFGVASVLVLAACGEETDKEDFVRKATEAGQFEITSSELAQEKSKRDDVKAFAQQMITDHTAASKKLDGLAAEVGVTLKDRGVGEKTEHTDDLEDLQKTTPDTFDREYIAKQEDAHEEAVKLFQGYADKGDDAKLKAFAAETLPTLKAHLEHVKKLKAGGGTS